MIEDILIPEELLQLDKLLSATELIEDSSFLAILGSDSSTLSISLVSYLTQNINSLKTINLKTTESTQPIANPYKYYITFNLVFLSQFDINIVFFYDK